MRASLALVVLAMVAPSVSGNGGKSMVRQSNTYVAIESDGSFSVVGEKKELALQQDIVVDDAGSGEQGRSGILPGAKIFLGIKSAPAEKYAQRRALWRQSDCAKNYAAAGISYAFFVGMPLDPNHNLTGHHQKGFETPRETAIEKAMLAENEKHQDMQILAMRDIYMDIPNKLIGMLNFAYHETDAEYIGEHDDEYCLEPQTILDAIAGHKKSKKKELWMGGPHFKGTEYKQMEGPRGTQYHGPGEQGMVAPYFSGHGCLLSRGLVKPIVVDNIALTILHGEYGTVADDANLGKWVSLAVQKQHVDVDSVFVTTASLLKRTDGKPPGYGGSLLVEEVEVAPPTVAPGLAAEEEESQETDEEPAGERAEEPAEELAEGADAADAALVEALSFPSVANKPRKFDH